jgi:hypothetical protein
LQAYVDPALVGDVKIVDLADPRCQELREHFTQKYRGIGDLSICLAVIFSTRKGTPLEVRLRYLNLGNMKINSTEIETVIQDEFFLPTETKKVVVPSVIDLRLPETQQWLSDSVREGIPGVKYRYGPDDNFISDSLILDGSWEDKARPLQPGELERLPQAEDGRVGLYGARGGTSDIDLPDGFAGILALLMFPFRGGSPITDAIGSWFRHLGAGAVIFPSARSDPFCLVENGRLSDFAGWNFLDYQDAPTQPRRVRVIAHPTTWVEPTYKRLIDSNASRAGSWRVSGNLETQTLDRKFQTELFFQRKYARISIEEAKQGFYAQSARLRSDKAFSLTELRALLSCRTLRLEDPISQRGVNREGALVMPLGNVIAKEGHFPPADTHYFRDKIGYGVDWFFYRVGVADAEIQVFCPVCDSGLIWPLDRGHISEKCENCGFARDPVPERNDVRREFWSIYYLSVAEQLEALGRTEEATRLRNRWSSGDATTQTTQQKQT